MLIQDLESRKGVSFLSRFIGSKKKDAYTDFNDDESEMGDKRTEGTDADVFSQPVGSNGFIPRFPAPPKYIKVRSHGKKEKDFNRVFLAQELQGRTGVEIAQAGGRLVKAEAYKASGSKKDGKAVWAMEFSKDGKYLAAGGQDYVVRIWAVISNAEERQAHETEEDAAGKEGEGVRLNAPVFKSRTVQEYGGHTASVLDLSWSKACYYGGTCISTESLTVGRIISSYRRRWTRQFACGMSAGPNASAVSNTAISLPRFNFTPVTIGSSWQDLWIRR